MDGLCNAAEPSSMGKLMDSNSACEFIRQREIEPPRSTGSARSTALLCRPHYCSEGMTDGRFHAAACSSDPHESIEDALILSHDHHLLASIKVQESLSGRFGIY